MRAAGLRLPILTLFLAAFGTVPGRGDEVLLLETADWVPTASVLTVPTSYVLATAAVQQTADRTRISFTSRGGIDLKGVDGTWELFEVAAG